MFLGVVHPLAPSKKRNPGVSKRSTVGVTSIALSFHTASAQTGQMPRDGAVIRSRRQLQTADIRHQSIGFTRGAAHVQRQESFDAASQ
jgi:hypothetical protein